MLLNVTHETRYAYTPAVETAQHMAHLRPRGSDTQQVLAHRLEVDPAPDQLSESIDIFGNARAFFSLQSVHRRLIVTARSRIETAAPLWPEQSPPWEQVRERYRYFAGSRWEPSAEFTFASRHAPRDPEFASYAAASFPAGAALLNCVMDLTHRLHADMKYDPKSTEINTPAVVALRQRKGVCQDFAHIGIACLRAMGLAARYVSGYLLTYPPPGRPRLIGSDASHAWLSVFVPASRETGGAAHWCDFDPTNDRSAGADYVTLAVGRDYADVTPIRGVIHGGARHTLKVAVTVQPQGEGTNAAPTAV